MIRHPRGALRNLRRAVVFAAARAPIQQGKNAGDMQTDVVVGVRGFEPPASASRTQRSTGLSHTPTGVPVDVPLRHYYSRISPHFQPGASHSGNKIRVALHQRWHDLFSDTVVRSTTDFPRESPWSYFVILREILHACSFSPGC